MKTYWNLTSIALLTCALVMPVIAPAVGPIQTETQRRDRTQDEWRTIATVSGAAALLGLLKKDKTLTFAGAAGTLYALYRYDEDAKSKDRLARARAQFFNRDVQAAALSILFTPSASSPGAIIPAPARMAFARREASNSTGNVTRLKSMMIPQPIAMSVNAVRLDANPPKKPIHGNRLTAILA